MAEDYLEYIRNKYGDSVKVGAGNVVDRDGFLFWPNAAPICKGWNWRRIHCITREQKGIGRGQATALIEVYKARDEYLKKPEYISPSARMAVLFMIIT